MTEENRRANVEIELARAAEALDSARILLEHGRHTDSASRAYYTVLYCARALLISQGLESRSHRGAAHLLNLHFVRPGRLAVETGRWLTRLQAEREAADYDAAAVFDEPRAREAVERARDFQGECLRTLREGVSSTRAPEAPVGAPARRWSPGAGAPRRQGRSWRGCLPGLAHIPRDLQEAPGPSRKELMP